MQANVSQRHHDAAEMMSESFSNVMEDFVHIPSSNDEATVIIDEEDIETNNAIDEVSNDLDKLLGDL